MSKYLLVFGSLRKTSKRGYNFDRFGKGTQTFITKFELDGYDMYSLSSYPAICPGKGKIVVELHEVQDEAADLIEDMEVGAGYAGVQVKLGEKHGIIPGETATIYTWPKERLEGYYPKVKSGDWN